MPGGNHYPISASAFQYHETVTAKARSLRRTRGRRSAVRRATRAGQRLGWMFLRRRLSRRFPLLRIAFYSIRPFQRTGSGCISGQAMGPHSALLEYGMAR
jgi:hypothetical protein